MSATSSNTSSLNSSNAFSYYYANPYFQGKAGATSTTAPGGFGTALYGTSTSSNAFSSNTTGRTTGTTATTGRNAATGNTATNAFGGNTLTGQNAANRGQTGAAGSTTSGIVVQLPRQISYTSTLNFPAPVVTMPQMQQNLRVSLDRSTMLSNPRGIELTMDGNVVVLKGNVATEDEQRLVEGMIRLTPGVRDVRNELKVPVAPPAP
jgi:osmotically-inducible protein OsmY